MEWSAVAGIGLRPFTIGLPLNTALNMIKERAAFIPQVEIRHSEQEPVSEDIVVDLVANGVRLVFRPVTQALTEVDVYNPRHLTFTLSERQFAGKDAHTFEDIFSVVSPCRGFFEQATGQYVLHKDGLAFFFDIPKAFLKSHEKHVQELSAIRKFPDGSDPVLTSFKIFSGKDYKRPNSAFQRTQSAYGELVLLHPARGLTFTKTSKRGSFGDTPQDLLSEIGAPDEITYKQDSSDYFFNYFSRGVDFLFNGQTHQVIKIILHSNHVAHYDFSIYSRCNFQIDLPIDMPQDEDGQFSFPSSSRLSGSAISLSSLAASERVITQQPRSPPASPPRTPGSRGRPDSDGQDSQEEQSPHSSSRSVRFTPLTKFDEVREFLGLEKDDSVVLNHPAEPNTVNIFPATRLWKHSNLIFEVTASGFLATVTVLPASG
eukprot:m.740698 g.740698  ORF g.740698 m.740698 type:complete len:430 (-) comp58930_c0_seq4:86-1375(-)